MTTRTILALAVIGALAGCASTATQGDFGKSVDSLIKAQAFNPASLTTPSTAAVTGVDPDYANNVVVEMRQDVSKREEIKEPIQMLMLGSGGGW